MKQRFLLLTLAVSAILAGAGFTVPEDSASPAIHQAENIFRRTIRRFNDARRLADIEFDKAHYAALQTAREKTKEAASDAIDDAFDKQVEKLKNNPPPAGRGPAEIRQ